MSDPLTSDLVCGAIELISHDYVSEEQRMEQTRKNIEFMNEEMAKEQEYYREQSHRGSH